MGWLPMYADWRDLDLLRDWLNAEQEVAFLVADGEKRWVAVDRVEQFIEGKYTLWHVPSGSLPVFTPQGRSRQRIKNPWTGWEETRPEPHFSAPFQPSVEHGPIFPGHPGVIYLKLWPEGLPWQRAEKKQLIGISSFSWLGNHYSMIGRRAHPETERWWQRLRRWVGKVAKRVPMTGPIKGPKPMVYAFPGALEAISEGRARSTI